MQREQINFLEQAEVFQNLIVYFRTDKQSIANCFGYSEGDIFIILKKLSLNTQIKDAIHLNKITEYQAKYLLMIKDNLKQYEIFEKNIKR